MHQNLSLNDLVSISGQLSKTERGFEVGSYDTLLAIFETLDIEFECLSFKMNKVGKLFDEFYTSIVYKEPENKQIINYIKSIIIVMNLYQLKYFLLT